jgi:hypothetical protein
MKLTKRNSYALAKFLNHQRERGFAVELIIAIMVLIIGSIIIFKLARLIKNIDHNSNTNSTQTGYATNYGGYFESDPGYGSVTNEAQGVSNPQLAGPSFSFNYQICPPGAVRVLFNSTNRYCELINLTTNVLILDFSLPSGTEVDTTNPIFNAVIYKSTNGTLWNPIATNYNIDLSATYQFTDTNYVWPAAFYRVEPQW